ncbi:MAG TPA: FixH family protein [Falsiroseomonas sp.]|jgi:nitrogen fixation protein FixH|nr:FixH family protein [Falsiroseomonas sp.]
MSDTTRPRNPGFDPNRSRWIPWVFVGAFAVIIAVNLVLVVASVTTFTGVTTGQSYDRGRAYNAVLAEAARQDALGWSARVALDGSALAVAMNDREGLPVGGRMEGVLLRPLEGVEIALDFVAAGPGRFIAFAGTPAQGQWEARLSLHGTDGQRFDIRQRILVR